MFFCWVVFIPLLNCHYETVGKPMTVQNCLQCKGQTIHCSPLLLFFVDNLWISIFTYCLLAVMETWCHLGGFPVVEAVGFNNASTFDKSQE